MIQQDNYNIIILCRVALDEARRRESDAEERAATAKSAQRRAEAAAGAAERRAADAECLRREGSSATAHAHSQLQNTERSLQVVFVLLLHPRMCLIFLGTK